MKYLTAAITALLVIVLVVSVIGCNVEPTTLTPVPALCYSQTSLSFSAFQGGTNPASQTLEVWNCGTGTLNWSVTGNATWLSLSPTSGTSTGEHDSINVSVNTSGLTAGTYNATITISDTGASNTPQTVPVTLTIIDIGAPPQICKNQTSLTFSAFQGGTNPASQTLEVWNCGTGTLNWSVTENATWISLSPTSGTSTGEHDSINVSVSTSGLTAGTYDATIAIYATGASNTPQTVPVNLTIIALSAPPQICKNQTSLSFTAFQGGANPVSQPLEVWNCGGGTLNWSVTDNASWLSLSPVGGTSTGEHDSINMSVNTSDLAAGTYNATITISATGALHTPETVQVTLTTLPLSAPPQICKNQTSLTFNALAPGTNPAAQTLEVWNCSGGKLNWSVTDNATWLSLSPASGTSTGEHDSINVSVNTSDLTWKTYYATITISATEASNTPQTVQVTLNIIALSAPPQICKNQTSLTFNAWAHGTNTAAQTLEVWNCGTGTLNWSVTDDATWLSLSPASGTSTGEQDSINVSVNTSDLTAGTYNATITISATGASNTPQTVPVTLTTIDIGAPPQICKNQTSLTFNALAHGAKPAAQTLEVWNCGTGTLNWSVTDNATWLSLSPASGTSTGEHDSINVSVNAPGFTAGTYNATITISATGASDTPQIVQVTLTLASAPS